jgi:hypothetical protein
MRLEILGKLKKYNDPIGKRTNDLPACSIVPQPTTLPRGPMCYIRTYMPIQKNFHFNLQINFFFFFLLVVAYIRHP